MKLPHRIYKIISEIEKERSSLISPRIANKLIKHFGGNIGHNYRDSEISLGYGLIHYGIIRNLRPKRVLCIGSMKGFIPAICALACKNSNYGHVDFVDAGYDKDNANHWGGEGFWGKVDPKVHFKTLELSSRITTHVTTSEKFAKTTKKMWSYIYIDADHSYKGVKKDFKLYWPRLEKKGYMSFHDILLKEHPEHDNFGVWKFWNEISNISKITIPYTIKGAIPSGLGILQKQ
jgi:hypothetical protein